MSELKEILRKALPGKPQAGISSQSPFLNEILAGTFLTESRKVLKITKDIPAADIIDPDSNFEIPDVLSQYCSLKPTQNQQLLYIDTETTGLSGGTGTLVFLVGMGWVDPAGLHLEQYFLCDPSGEQILLTEIESRLKQFDTLVTFNGKSFDLPLLKTRFIMNGASFDPTGLDHIDLLHVARRFWKKVFASCSLQTLEEKLLSMIRDQDQDIPGDQIPQIYFNFLDRHETTFLKNIIQHNQQDIISLILLFDKIIKVLLDPAPHLHKTLIDHTGVARFYESYGEKEKAEDLYRDNLRGNIDKQVNRRQLSFLYKKNAKLDEAVNLWVDAAAEDEIYACLELAKFYEHKSRDFAQARKWTEQAIRLVEQVDLVDNRLLRQLHYRNDRLRKKIESETAV